MTFNDTHAGSLGVLENANQQLWIGCRPRFSTLAELGWTDDPDWDVRQVVKLTSNCTAQAPATSKKVQDASGFPTRLKIIRQPSKLVPP
ncbi:hypothetical protein PtA15_8A567 [Puccinia triticina]|uniref:Uncharacterized protein n=1 Tax=Puccinia triticina TaxID=208348 RepID=A0ABY7CQW3_9BASI|nr:uncharacterized protein PtA15_8A567 [Puccinia triticina]WAQ87661.1 hypothetical protein PtA15_8A567 [Puccinia triticina]WAR57521.1 hypothetical protein PtB15_8B571 [Puccinia triticina]